MKESEISNDEKNFLRLMAKNIWIARGERAVAGSLYTLSMVLLGYVAITELRWTDPMSMLCCSGILVTGGGVNVLVGAPDTVADEMAHWIDEAGIRE